MKTSKKSEKFNPVYVLHLNERFMFPVSAERTWAKLCNVDSYPVWWRWLKNYQVDGERTLTEGTVLSGLVVPPIPYRFHVGIQLDEIVPTKSIVASLVGDLRGPANITFHDVQDGCEMVICWDVEMQKRSMRAAAHMSKPLLVWGHDQVVSYTASSFARILADETHDSV